MLTYFNRLSKAASVVALALGVAFAAVPAQKASAQFVGAGASSLTTLLKDNTSASGSGPVWDYANSFGTPYQYFVTGSDTGLAAFLNGSVDFVATDSLSLGTSFGANTSVRNNTIFNARTNAPVIDPLTGSPYVVVNVAFPTASVPYNVPTDPTKPNSPQFDVSVTGVTACSILRGSKTQGDPTNWNQVFNGSGVRGPNLPIIRVVRSDNKDLAFALGQFFNGCDTIAFFFNGIVFKNPDGTFALPNARLSDIIVAPPANPFNTTDGSNPNSYTLGVINAIKNTPGAIGIFYAETALTRVPYPNFPNGLPLGGDAEVGAVPLRLPAILLIFRRSYNNASVNGTPKGVYAQNVCFGAIFSGFLNEAGFRVANNRFPVNFGDADSPDAGLDVDNYGALTLEPFDFGPCGRIQ